MTRYFSDLLRRSSKFWERVPLELLNSGVKSLTKNSASVEESPVCNLTIVAGKRRNEISQESGASQLDHQAVEL